MNLLPLGNMGPTASAALPSFLAEAPPFVLPFGVTVPVEVVPVEGPPPPLLSLAAAPQSLDSATQIPSAWPALEAITTVASKTADSAQAPSCKAAAPPMPPADEASAPPSSPAPALEFSPLQPTLDQVSDEPVKTKAAEEPEIAHPAADLAQAPEDLTRPVLPPPFPPPPIGEPLPRPDAKGETLSRSGGAKELSLPLLPTRAAIASHDVEEAEQAVGVEAPAMPPSEQGDFAAPANAADLPAHTLQEAPAIEAAALIFAGAVPPPASPPLSALGVPPIEPPLAGLAGKQASPAAPKITNDNDKADAPRSAPATPNLSAQRQIGTGTATPSPSLALAEAKPPQPEAATPAAPATTAMPVAPQQSRPADQATPALTAPLAPPSPVPAPHPAPASPAATPLPRVEFTAPRFAEHVGIAITRRPGGLQPGDELVLQIEPAHLGRIRVELNFAPDGKLEALVTADQPRVLDQLKLHAADLHRALIEAGGRSDIAAPRFEPRQESGGSFAPQTGSNPQNFASNGNGSGGNPAQSQQQPRTSLAYPADPLSDPDRPAQPLRTAAGRLDLIA